MKRKPSVKKQPTPAHLLMWNQLLEFGTPNLWSVGKEYQFALPRKWAFDFMIWNDCPIRAVGIEIDGGVWIQGRHNRGSGFLKDCEKFNHAALLGWRVLRFTPQQVLKGEAIAFIKRVLES